MASAVGLRELEAAGLFLVELPREGRCLAAKVDGRGFPAGSVLLAEKALVRDSVEELAEAMSASPHRFSLLRGEENLAAADVSGESRNKSFFLQAETNSFIFAGRHIAFNAFSMMNHACAGSLEENACYNILGTGDKPIDDNLEVKLVATRDILAGEPIRLSYHQLFAKPKARTERIRSHCGGTCACSRCRLDALGDQALLQLDAYFVDASCCQHCGRVAADDSTRLQAGDLCQADSQEQDAYCKVIDVPSDHKCMVKFLSQGLESKRLLKRSQLKPLCKGKGLQKCGQCKSVFFCSRDCQKGGWKEHKRFCSAAKGDSATDQWLKERAELRALREELDDYQARQGAPLEQLQNAFDQVEKFILRWTQPGRAPHLAFGHQAIQDAISFALPLGMLALYRTYETGSQHGGESSAALFDRVARLADLHLRQVRLLVGRFHIAHWTALHHVSGLVSLQHLQLGVNATMLNKLREDLRKNVDVARIYDPALAATICEGFADSGDSSTMAEGSKLFQMMAQDPAKLAEFYSIDPEAPMDHKMEQMAKLLCGMENKGVPNPRRGVVQAAVPKQAAPKVKLKPQPQAPEKQPEAKTSIVKPADRAENADVKRASVSFSPSPRNREKDGTDAQSMQELEKNSSSIGLNDLD